MQRYPDLEPDVGEVLTADVVDEPDVLVKAFALGPGASVAPHEHPGATNVFHILAGTVTVLREQAETRVDAPDVVVHQRGVPHGARNDMEDVATFTASLCPRP